MTDLDINQTSIISIYYIKNTATEILPVCSSPGDIMMQADVQEIRELELNLEATQILNFSNFILW